MTLASSTDGGEVGGVGVGGGGYGNAEEPRYQRFETADGFCCLTFIGTDGERIYEDDEGDWRVFPPEWADLGTFTTANEAIMVTWVSDEGVSYETYVNEEGQRFYCDFDVGDWVPFPSEWEGTGTFVASGQEPTIHGDDGDEGQAEDEYGTLVAPDGQTVTTYETEVVVRATFYYDTRADAWRRVPRWWTDGLPSTTSGGNRVDTPRSSVLSRGSMGTRGSHWSDASFQSATDLGVHLAARPTEASLFDFDRMEKENETLQQENESLRTKVQELVEQGNRNIQRARKKIRAQERTFRAELAALRSRNEEMTAELELRTKALNEWQARHTDSGTLVGRTTSVAETADDGSASPDGTELASRASAGSSGPAGDGGTAELVAAVAERDERLRELDARLIETETRLVSRATRAEARVRVLESGAAELRADATQMESQIIILRELATGMQAEARSEYDGVKARIVKAIGRFGRLVSDLEAKLRAEMLQRKLLHNKLIELRGNIRVMCRCRGLLPNEEAKGETSVVDVVNDETVTVRGKAFEFDRSFGPSATQEDVFADVKPLATSCVDGYNVCIFAYGQTGSGKTYTMFGTKAARGVNWRSLDEIFAILHEREAHHGWTFDVSVSFLEIYNEQVRDLLEPTSDKGEAKRLDVRLVAETSDVPGLARVAVSDVDAVFALLLRGEENRTTGSTSQNAMSSRSHSVLQVHVSGRHGPTSATTAGKLTLVDLAGSERVSKSDATGQRLVEAAAINKSLSALGNVIAALQAEQRHVPYRDSKLTTLLRDSLGGDAKTLMMVNVNPALSNRDESLYSLKFAQRARQVATGPATQKRGGGGAPTTSAGRSPKVLALSAENLASHRS